MTDTRVAAGFFLSSAVTQAERLAELADESGDEQQATMLRAEAEKLSAQVPGDDVP
jgi:hypothetical protein